MDCLLAVFFLAFQTAFEIGVVRIAISCPPSVNVPLRCLPGQQVVGVVLQRYLGRGRTGFPPGHPDAA